MQEGKKPFAAHDLAAHPSGADVRGARRGFGAEAEEDERLEAFLRRRRAERASRHQQRKYLIAIAFLGVACLALAVSVVLLAVRLSAVQAPRAVAPPTPGPAASEEGRAGGPAERGGEAGVEEALALLAKALGEQRRRPGGETTPEATLPGGPAVAPDAAESPPTAVEPPSRSARTAPRQTVAPEPAPVLEIPRETDPAWRMAALMLQTYGKAGAEERARAAAAFHGPRHPDTDFWRSVLAHIRSAPQQ